MKFIYLFIKILDAANSLINLTLLYLFKKMKYFNVCEEEKEVEHKAVFHNKLVSATEVKKDSYKLLSFSF
jgi:hypothetical protein